LRQASIHHQSAAVDDSWLRVEAKCPMEPALCAKIGRQSSGNPKRFYAFCSGRKRREQPVQDNLSLRPVSSMTAAGLVNPAAASPAQVK
jgi:hypothetical protein